MNPFLNIQDIATLTGFEFETPCRFYATHIQLKNDIALCRILTRYKVYVDLRDRGIAPHLILDGYWETWLTQFLASIVKPGDVCIDIGANFGYYSVLMSALSGDSGKTIAIEPNPAIAKLLRMTAGLNSPGFKVEESALADKRGELMLTIPDELFGSASLVDQDFLHSVSTKSIPVKVKTLDEIVEEYNLSKIDIIKMDVEGAEPLVFEGMKKTIRQNPNLQIIMEYSPYLYQSSRDFTKYLFRHFEVHRLKDGIAGEALTNEAIKDLLALDDHTDLYLKKKEES